MTDQEAAQAIGDRIRQHYEAVPMRLLHLAQLGSWLSSQEIHPPEGTTVSGWLQSLLSGEFVVVTDASNPARRAIAPAGAAAEWAREAIQSIKASESPAHAQLRHYPKALLVAFVKRLVNGERMFIEDVPPFKYKIGTFPPGPGWLEIAAEFRAKGQFFLSGVGSLSDSDALALLDAMQRWCVAVDRSPAHFQNVAEGSKASLLSASNALERLIAAQPPELRSRINVPLDIIELLLRQG